MDMFIIFFNFVTSHNSLFKLRDCSSANLRELSSYLNCDLLYRSNITLDMFVSKVAIAANKVSLVT